MATKAKRKPTNTRKPRKSWKERESRDMKRDSEKKEYMDRESTNDPQWYATDPSLLRDSASYPFSQPLGEPVILSPTLQHKMPGVCALKLVPSIGYAADPTSAVNVAAKSIYSFIRHANSGAKVYDAPDMMIYLLAMSNVYAAINWAQRLYGFATLYIQRNRYLPGGLFYTEKVDMMSIVNNLANYRFRLNVLINKVASMAVPANMTVFRRIAFLYTNLYSEGASPKDQLYMYVPQGFFKFAIDSTTGAGKLTFDDPKTHAASPTSMKWDEVIGFIESLMDSIWAEEDFGIMSGDILKAYGDNIIKLESLPEMYPILPVFDPMVLTQMKNATLLSCDTTVLTVEQDATKAYLVSLPTPTSALATRDVEIASSSKILTIEHEAPTPEMVIEASRLQVSTIHASSSGQAWYSCGTEICTSVECVTMDNTGAYTSIVQTGHITDSITMGSAFDYVSAIKAFKYLPAVYLRNATSGSVSELFFEVDNFTLLDANNVDKLHTAAILNMLNVPSIAKNIGR